MASLSTDELRALPFDVVINHLVPLLAKRSTPNEELDRWAIELSEWAAKHRNVLITDLPGFRPMGGTFEQAYVYEAKLVSYMIWGAEEDMPCSVFRKLSVHENSCNCDPLEVYMANIHYRRVQQGKMEWEDAKPVLGGGDHSPDGD